MQEESGRGEKIGKSKKANATDAGEKCVAQPDGETEENLVKSSEAKISFSRMQRDDVIYDIIWRELQMKRVTSHIHEKSHLVGIFLPAQNVRPKMEKINFLPRFTTSFCIQFLFLKCFGQSREPQDPAQTRRSSRPEKKNWKQFDMRANPFHCNLVGK